MRILKNVKLAPYTTFRIGGPAELFAEAKSLSEIKESVKFARKNKLKIFVLGGGSNILISDDGVRGLVLRLLIRGADFRDKGSFVLASVGAGEIWDKVVAWAVRHNFGGIENLSLIPGTVGGAVHQNIGAYGTELKDVLHSVNALNIKSGEVLRLSKKGCRFGYRDSIFQHKIGKNYIVLSAVLRLDKKPKPKIIYSDLVKYFQNKKEPSIQKIREAVIRIRRSKLIYPDQFFGTAGSFLKNPVISSGVYKRLIGLHPGLKGRISGRNLVKLSAGQLIELSGWKGKRIGSVGVSKKHALVLVNYGRGRAQDIKKFASLIGSDVERKFGVKLEPEVRFVGEI